MSLASSSSALLNVAEDAELRLVRLLAESAPADWLNPSFVKDCEACILHADASELVRTIVKDRGAMAALFLLEPAEEAISAFSLLAALLDRAKTDHPDQEKMLAQVLADSVINAKVDDHNNNKDISNRQISMLSALFNMRSDGTEKCALLAAMIRLAAAHRPAILSVGQPLGNMLFQDNDSEAPRLVSMLDAWDVPQADRRTLFRATADGMSESPATKQRYTLLLVESYTDASQVDELGLAAARDAAVGAIRDPVTLFVHQRRMLGLPAIQSLGNSPATRPLLGLLSVFQEGMLEEYNSFVKENGGEDALLSPWGLSPSDCMRHMRILSLCSLAAEHEEVPYTVVAKTLQLPSDEEVESWVIAAVSSGLLAAKMDQLQHKIIVERSVVRRFDMEQWKALQKRLHSWKQNVRGILNGLKASKAGSSAVTQTSI